MNQAAAAASVSFLHLRECHLDWHFLGQFTWFQADEYHTVKAGSQPLIGSIRSRVNRATGELRLVGYLPQQYNVQYFPADGRVGLFGKITERLRVDTEKHQIEVLYLHHVPSHHIAEMKVLERDVYTFQGVAEFDDVLFNLNKEFTFPVTYYARKKTGVFGLEVRLPLQVFNQYVAARDTWYKDYAGAHTVALEDEIVEKDEIAANNEIAEKDERPAVAATAAEPSETEKEAVTAQKTVA